MCKECGFYPCDYRCPNAAEPKRVFICSGCGGDILEGDDYYDVLGEQFCVDCMDDMRKVAELDEWL